MHFIFWETRQVGGKSTGWCQENCLAKWLWGGPGAKPGEAVSLRLRWEGEIHSFPPLVYLYLPRTLLGALWGSRRLREEINVYCKHWKHIIEGTKFYTRRHKTAHVEAWGLDNSSGVVGMRRRHSVSICVWDYPWLSLYTFLFCVEYI